MNAEENTRNQRVKWCFESCKNGAWGDEPDGLNDVACIRAADFDGTSGRLVHAERTIRTIDARTFAKVALQRGDLVIEKSGGGDKQLVGRTVVYDSVAPAVCSNFLARMRLRNGMDASYVNYLLLSIYNARGTYPHIKQSTGIQNLDLASYLNTRADIPPLETQRRIARFLDAKTARIDALIATKRALLERLAEKRQALITQAVTQGLDPTVPMKDSGIDWLGQVPAHWGIVPIRWFLRTGSGDGIRGTEIESDRTAEAAVPVIGGNGCMGFTASANSEGASLVVGRVGALCGNVHPIAEPSWVTDNALKLYGLRNFEPLYLLHALRVRDLNALASRNAQPLMTGEIVRAQQMPMPPPNEQVEIAESLTNQLSAMDTRDSRVQRSVDLLQEYRSALITAAVTGQLDIPAALPEDQAEAPLGTLATEEA